MNIKYIVNARIPTEKAHGYQICKMCSEFAKQGSEVELIAPTRDNPINEDAFSYYNIEKNFQIKYLKSFDFLRFVKLFGRYSFYAQALLFWLKLLKYKLSRDNSHVPHSQGRVREAKDLIYTRNPEIVWLFKKKGFKVAYECHDWFKGKTRLALWLLKDCDHIITTNNFIKQGFLDNGFDEKKLLTAPNGIDLKIFDLDIEKEEAIKKLDLDEKIKAKMRQSTVLLYTGSFKTMGVGKGVEEILEALKKSREINDKPPLTPPWKGGETAPLSLKGEAQNPPPFQGGVRGGLPEIGSNPNLFFLAVGGNEKDINYYQDIAKNNNLSNTTAFLPRQTQPNLALFQKASDIMLMPFPKKAHYEYHMTPLKMFEYMASQRPIIASDLPSIKQILNSQNAFFCEPGNVDSLTEAILYVLGNKDEVYKKVVQSSEDVKVFAWEKRAGKILSFIR